MSSKEQPSEVMQRYALAIMRAHPGLSYRQAYARALSHAQEPKALINLKPF